MRTIPALGNMPLATAMITLVVSGMIAFSASALGANYMGIRVRGLNGSEKTRLRILEYWRAIFAYRRGMKRNNYPAWPMYLWLISTPLALLICLAGYMLTTGNFIR